jgi:hypothetical protein
VSSTAEGLALRPTAPWSDALSAAFVALLARMLCVVWASASFPAVEDGRFYHVIAQRIAAGHGYTWLWPDGAVTYAAHYPVGYPALLGLIYALFGPGLTGGMIFNALLGSASVVAVHRVASTAASRTGALFAALAVALHPGLVMYTPALMTEGVAAALLGLLAWVVVHTRTGSLKNRWLWPSLLGLGFGVATLVRPQLLVLAPLWGWLAFSGVRRSAVAALLAGALALFVCLPWTARNCARMDRCVFVSANAGWNLLIGSVEDATGSWLPIEGKRVPAACRQVLGEAGKDSCFVSAALSEIASRPLAWVALAPSKLGNTFDYCGAAGWYLHASNPRVFVDRAKVELGFAETLWQRLLLGLALGALASWHAPRQKLRILCAGLGAVWLITPASWPSYLALVVCALLLGRALLRQLPAAFAASAVLATALTHVLFFGAGRYSLVCFPLIAALAGTVLRDPNRAFDSPPGAG